MSETTELQNAVERLTRSIESLEQKLVRKDVYEVNERARDAAFVNLREDLRGIYARLETQEEKRAADRRLIVANLVLPILVALVLLYVATQIGGGGG